eukprot:COSAG01_NODE_35175_length_535_cov_10.759174_2_plen_88_part_00
MSVEAPTWCVHRHRHLLRKYRRSRANSLIRDRWPSAQIMELARGGELFAKLCEIGKFKEEEARFYWQQLLQVRLHPLPAASNGGQCL